MNIDLNDLFKDESRKHITYKLSEEEIIWKGCILGVLLAFLAEVFLAVIIFFIRIVFFHHL